MSTNQKIFWLCEWFSINKSYPGTLFPLSFLWPIFLLFINLFGKVLSNTLSIFLAGQVSVFTRHSRPEQQEFREFLLTLECSNAKIKICIKFTCNLLKTQRDGQKTSKAVDKLWSQESIQSFERLIRKLKQKPTCATRLRRRSNISDQQRFIMYRDLSCNRQTSMLETLTDWGWDVYLF